MNILTKSIITLAALATTGLHSLHAETFPVVKDTFGSTVTNKITKVAGKGVVLPVNAKSAAFLDFGVKAGGYTASQVSGARITIFLPKVTTAGNLNLSFATSAFQEVFITASIPAPTSSSTLAQIPITKDLTKNFVTIDVTDEIKQILNSPDEFGFVIKSDGTANCTIGSKEGSATGYPAVLELDVNTGGLALSGTTGSFTELLTGTNATFSGNLGLGTTSPAARLHVVDPGAQTGTIQVGGTDGNGAPKLVQFGDNGLVSIGENGEDDRMVLTAKKFFFTSVTNGDGNVGIGIDSPTAKLHVNGTARVEGTTTFLNNVIIQGNKSLTIGGTGEISVGGDINSASNITAFNTLSSFNGNIVATSGSILAPSADGKIGIGTSAPTRSLTVESATAPFMEIKNTSGSGSAGVFTTASNRTWFMGSRLNSQNWTVFDNTAGQPRLNVTQTGAVGIGFEAPAGMLHVNGAIFCASLTETSDVRFKKEIEPISYGLDAVRKLRPVSYDWRRDEFPERKFDEGRQLGFIAQEIREILPQVVVQAGEYYQVHYTSIVPVLTRAIQELAASKDAEIAALTEKLAASEARRAALDADIQARIARLEASSGTPALQSTSSQAAAQQQ